MPLHSLLQTCAIIGLNELSFVQVVPVFVSVSSSASKHSINFLHTRYNHVGSSNFENLGDTDMDYRNHSGALRMNLLRRRFFRKMFAQYKWIFLSV